MVHNKSRFTAFFSLLLCLCLVLSMAGCGANSSPREMQMDSSYAPMSPPDPAPMPAPAARMSGERGVMMSAQAKSNPDTNSPVALVPEGNGNDMASNVAESAAVEPEAPSERKLVKNADMSLETKEFDTAIPELIRMVTAVGGYVEKQSVDGRSIQNTGDYYERTAYLTMRVPADKLSDLTAQMGTLCNVSSQSESIDDITDRYYDASAHLEMLRVQEKRLLELLEKAETLENIIQLEQALTNCQYEIESLTGQLRRMDSQVSYSTLSLTVSEVVDYTITTEKPKNFMERLGDAFTHSGKNLARATEGILFFLIIDGPVVAIYLAFWGVIAYLVYRIVRKRRTKHETKPMAERISKAPESRPDEPKNQ